MSMHLMERISKNCRMISQEEAAVSAYTQIDLYSRTSRLAMARLGFLPEDLEPLSPSRVQIPNRYEEFSQEFVRQKIHYAQKLRENRMKAFIQEVNAIREEAGATSRLIKKNRNRSAKPVASQETPARISRREVSHTKRNVQLLKESSIACSNRINFSYNQWGDQSYPLNNNNKNLSLEEKRLLNHGLSKQNTNFGNMMTESVHNSSRKESVGYSSKFYKPRVFNMKQGIKAEEAWTRRSKESRMRERMEIQYKENEIEVLNRLNDLQARKKAEQEERKKEKEQRYHNIKMKNMENSLISSEVKQYFKEYLTFKLENADKIKENYNKRRVKGSMQWHLKGEEVVRNREIIERKHNMVSPDWKLKFHVRSQSSTSQYRKNKAKTKEHNPILENKTLWEKHNKNEKCRQTERDDFLDFDRLVGNRCNTELEMTISNSLSLPSFLRQVRGYLRSLQEESPMDEATLLENLQKQCSAINRGIQESSSECVL